MKIKVTLVKAYIVSYPPIGHMEIHISQNIDNNSKGASHVQRIHAYIIV